MECPSLSILIDFRLKSILLAIRIAVPASFLGLFDWYFFPTLYSEMMSVTEVDMYFLSEEEGWILFLCPIC